VPSNVSQQAEKPKDTKAYTQPKQSIQPCSQQNPEQANRGPGRKSRFFAPEPRQGPEPKHPSYAYSTYVEQYPDGTYLDSRGAASHGKININMLSNWEPRLWKSRCGEPCFCYDHLVKGYCKLQRNCYLRHIKPTVLERPSMEWFNSVLLAAVDDVAKKRSFSNQQIYTRLFKGMHSCYMLLSVC
jgi:hypothetical protein